MGWLGDFFAGKHPQRWYQKNIDRLLTEKQVIQREIDVARRKWGEWADELFLLDDEEFEKKRKELLRGFSGYTTFEDSQKRIRQKEALYDVSQTRKLRERISEIDELITKLKSDM